MKKGMVLLLAVLFIFFSCNLGGDGGSNSVNADVNVDVDEGGEDPAEETVDIGATMSAGITHLNAGEYNDALLAFETVVGADPDHSEAVMYWIYLKAMSVSVKPEVVALARGAGISSYPDDMETLFSEGGLSTIPVLRGVSSYSSYNGSSFDTYYEESYNLFPAIDVPAEYQSSFNLDPYYATQDSSFSYRAGAVTSSAYNLAIIYNLSKAYPNGFTQPLEDVTDMLDVNLSEMRDILDGLNGQDTISLTYQMFNPNSELDPFSSGWPIDDLSGEPEEIIIGQAELQLSIASLEILASLFNTTASISLSFPFDELWGEVSKPIIGDQDVILTNLPTYPMADMLQSKDNSALYLGRAKNHMSSALSRIDNSIDLMQARTAQQSFTFNLVEMDPYYVEVLDVVDIMVSNMSSSIDNGTTFLIPMDLLDSGASSIYSSAANWPSAVDWSEDIYGDFPHSGNVLGFDLSALYDQPLLALDKLFSLDSNGEPVYYDGAGNVVTSITLAEMNQAINDGEMYALKLNDITLGGFIDYGTGTVADTTINGIIWDLYMDYDINLVRRGDSLYLNDFVPAEVIYAATHTAGSTFSYPTNGGTETRQTTGSFWYVFF